MNPYPYAQPQPSNQPFYQQQPPPMGQYPPQGGYAPTNAYPPTAYPQTQMGYVPPMGTVPQPVVSVTQPVISVPPAAASALFGGLQFIYVQDPMTELTNTPSLLIRQEPELVEAMTGCEQPNIYHVFGNSPLGFRYLFKCIEKSSFCQRRFCRSEQRALDLDLIHCTSVDQLGMGYTTPFATMQKPCMCTCFCLARPEISVVINSTAKPVGKVKYIFTCCDPTFEVFSMSGGLKYIVTADCCQCALRCNGFWGKTSQGVFEIIDTSTNQKVGRITKEPCASVEELVTDADTYVVNFPPNADANDKLLLTGLAIMIDYQFFETEASDNHKKKRRSRSRKRRRH